MIKKLISLILLLSAAVCANAELRWGATAGVNISDFKFKQDLLDPKTGVGFNVGAMGEVMIPGIGFGIDFAVRYNMHGGKINFGKWPVWSTDGFDTENVVLHTIQLPLNLRFKYTRFNGFEDYLAPFVYAGPVFSFTVAHSDVKALQYPAGSVGVQFGLGAEILKHFQISAGYHLGLTYEIRTVKLDNFSARSNYWTVNVAYLF